MINALTIDVEDWFQGLELEAAPWGACEPRLAVGLERLLSLLHEEQVRATFSVLGSAAERHPEWVRLLAEFRFAPMNEVLRHQPPLEAAA